MKIYHNPRCSKSRETLKLLTDNGITPEIVQYLDTPPSASELQDVLDKLGLSARALLRESEPEYQAQQLHHDAFSDQDLIAAMVSCPKLIQRPIVISGNQAVIGRPPSNVLRLL